MLMEEVIKEPRIRKKSELLIFDTTNWNQYAHKKYKSGPAKVQQAIDQAVPAPSNRRKSSGLQNMRLHLAEEFSKLNSIHGLDRLFGLRISTFERLLWCTGTLVALILLIIVCLVLATRNNRRTFRTVVDTTQYPVYKIPFPEVTICNRNRLNWARLQQAKDRFLMPAHQTAEYELLFMEILAIYDTLTFGNFEQFETIADKSIDKLNYINFTNAVTFMSWRCHELLENCVWRYRTFDCCDIFVPRISQLGLCLAFNSLESPEGKIKQQLDSKWPWRTSTEGPGNGLSMRVLMQEHQHSPYSTNKKGLTFMITEPYVWYNYDIDVNQNTKTNIGISAVMSFFDEETMRASSLVRECVFEYERQSRSFKSLPGRKYMFENCQSECQQGYLLQFCNCTMDLFYPTGTYRVCQLTDLPCLAKYNDRFQHFEQFGENDFISMKMGGMSCKCFLNCESLEYSADVVSTYLRPDETIANKSAYIEMDFHFRSDSIMVYKTTFIYTWVDLMASFGGAACLFLGASLISLVELAYFFFFDMPTWLWQQHRNTQRVKAITRKVKDNVRELLQQYK